MYKYANFDQNIPCGFRVMIIFTKRPRQAKNEAGQNLGTILHTHGLDNVNINRYAKFDPNIPCGLRVMSIITNWLRQAGLMLSKASSIKYMWWPRPAIFMIYKYKLAFILFVMTSSVTLQFMALLRNWLFIWWFGKPDTVLEFDHRRYFFSV